MSENFNYKIRNKVTGKFFSSSTKATWRRKNAVIDFLSRIKKNNGNIEDIEVLIFPIENAVIKSANDFLDENHDEIESKKIKKEERKLREKEENTLREIRELEKRLLNTKNELNKLRKENER